MLSAAARGPLWLGAGDDLEAFAAALEQACDVVRRLIVGGRFEVAVPSECRGQMIGLPPVTATVASEM